ncbi:hypothetical protein [Neomicrococcus lactis]|uniref:hypothetical protein n=1 Tax=Neomicrococcus lactis TaxID=732241 RepID=UPI002301C36E|nr:hypothetical protein [Neomicrococcus lactis]
MTSPQLAELTTIIAAYYELPADVLRGNTAEEITEHAKAIREMIEAPQVEQ